MVKRKGVQAQNLEARLAKLTGAGVELESPMFSKLFSVLSL